MNGVEPKKSESVLGYAIRSVVVIFVVVVVVVLIVVNLLSGRIGIGATATGTPSAGEIWFGSVNAQFAVTQRTDTSHPGEPMRGSAHLNRAVSGPSDIRVHIAKDGAPIADQQATNLAPTGDFTSFTYTIGSAGTYIFTVVTADGSVLATGSLGVK
jgi:hypothetical protein